jgi:hypothetical protein
MENATQHTIPTTNPSLVIIVEQILACIERVGQAVRLRLDLTQLIGEATAKPPTFALPKSRVECRVLSPLISRAFVIKASSPLKVTSFIAHFSRVGYYIVSTEQVDISSISKRHAVSER